MNFARYYAAAFRYGWRMARNTGQIPTFILLVPAHAMLLPVFLCLPSYRRQVKEWNNEESNS